MVDDDRASLRLRRLEELVENLEGIRERGEEAYLADPGSRAMVLGNEGLIEKDLAERLAEAAKQRNLLVHLNLDIDDRKVFESLSHLDDLRRFGAFVADQLD